VGANANIDRETDRETDRQTDRQTSPAMVILIDQEKDGISGMNTNSQIQIHRII